MVGEVAAHDLVPGRLADGREVLARQLPRRLNRFAAPAREVRPVEIAWGEVRQPGGQFNACGVAVSPQREVGEPGHLLVGGLGEFGPPVADLGDEQAGQAVEEPVAGVVPHVAAVGPLDDRHGGRRAEVAPEMATRGGPPAVHGPTAGGHIWICLRHYERNEVHRRS